MPSGRRAFIAAVSAASILGPRRALSAEARVYRLGGLWVFECPPTPAAQNPLSKQLADLGYVEGRNLVIDTRCWGIDPTRGPRSAAELVSLRPDVLITSGTTVTRVLQAATKTIPIVTAVNDPVASGFAASLARSGGNIAGFTHIHPSTRAKQLELLRLVVPKLERLALIGDSRYPGAEEQLTPMRAAARAAGLDAQLRLAEPSTFNRVFSEIRRSRAQAAFLMPMEELGCQLKGPATSEACGPSTFLEELAQAAGFAIRYGVPTLYHGVGYVQVGGLMSYSMRHSKSNRFIWLIDRIFKGDNPANLPWELPDRAHLAINLRTAKLLGVAIPPDLVVGADQVVEIS
jgi:putative ABC transport system substrate-binding protein